MKLTKAKLKQLIKEAIFDYGNSVADKSIYREFYSDNVDRLKMKYINNEYKSVIMYARRLEDPRLKKFPERYEKEKHYYIKSINRLEKFVAPVKDKLRKEDSQLLLSIIRKAREELKAL